MAGASDETQTMHLTEDGWISGGGKYDYGKVEKDVIPADTVLSVTKHAWCGTIGSPSSAGHEINEVPRTDDKDLVSKLKKKYGEPVFGI